MHTGSKLVCTLWKGDSTSISGEKEMESKKEMELKIDGVRAVVIDMRRKLVV